MSNIKQKTTQDQVYLKHFPMSKKKRMKRKLKGRKRKQRATNNGINTQTFQSSNLDISGGHLDNLH